MIARLRYVFDISDTHMVAGSRFPYLWQMQEYQREEILFHLTEVHINKNLHRLTIVIQL